MAIKACPSVVRVAAVGCGHWGRNVVRVLDDLGVLASVTDADEATAAKVAADHEVQSLSLDDALSSDAEAVAIASPAVTHASIASRALEAGKHVYVEKPLALEVADAVALCELARERDRTLMVGHLLQYHPAFRRLESLAAAGEFGRLLYVYSNRLNFGRFRREENILWSFAPHDISMILRLVGEEPTEVSAVRSTFLHEIVADVTTTHLTFPSGVDAHVFVSWLHPFKEQKLVVVGDEAMAVFDDGQPWERKIVVYRHLVEWHEGMPSPSPAEAEAVSIEPDEPLKVELAHFVDCAASGSTPRTDGPEGVRVLRVLDAAERSMRSRSPVSLADGEAT